MNAPSLVMAHLHRLVKEKHMKVIRDKVEADTVLSEDTQLFGMIVGKTTVSENTLLELHGMIVGDLVLEKGSTVYLHGMVNGNVTNKGGVLRVFGMVNGQIVRQSGQTVVDFKASIRNGIH